MTPTTIQSLALTTIILAAAFFGAVATRGASASTDSEQAPLRPTVSIVDFLKKKGMKHSVEDRRKLYQREFGADTAFSGTKEQNIRLLRHLLAQETLSCGSLSNSVLTRTDAVLGLIGGFGWGSRSVQSPEIWDLKPDQVCNLEPGVFGLITERLKGDWDRTRELADAIRTALRAQSGDRGPVVIVGHSYGGLGAVRTATHLHQGDTSVKIDLLVLVDAVDPGSPIDAARRLEIPENVINVVHVTAADPHWLITITRPEGDCIEYQIAGVTHTDIDSAPETIQIIRYLMQQLPPRAANNPGAELDVAFPKCLTDFPAALRASWRTVTVKPTSK